MFDAKDAALQGICSVMFWSHRVASAATDVAIGESLNANPVGELRDALERLEGIAHSWLLEIDPNYKPREQGVTQSAKLGSEKERQ